MTVNMMTNLFCRCWEINVVSSIVIDSRATPRVREAAWGCDCSSRSWC